MLRAARDCGSFAAVRWRVPQGLGTLDGLASAWSLLPAFCGFVQPWVLCSPQFQPKRYFTIGEVAELCGVKPHVLRYWEQEFTQLRPMKRRGNRRYYQHHEVLMIRRIRDLLYDQGFTISGARNKLQEMPMRSAAPRPPMQTWTAVSRRMSLGPVRCSLLRPCHDMAADAQELIEIRQMLSIDG